MSMTKIGPKHQITIPKDAFEALRLGVGDMLDAEVQGGKLVLVPKRLTEKAPVPKLTPAEQKLLMRARVKIERIRKDLATARGLSAAEADIAARVGLIDRDQRWWWTEQWQRGERHVERELRSGRTKTFENVHDLIDDLRVR